MRQATNSFLASMAASKAVNSAEIRQTAMDAVRAVGELVAESGQLLLDYQDMVEAEEDLEVKASLGEYEQKLKVIERTGTELRDKLLRFRRALNELDEVEKRVGAPLRATRDDT